MQQFMTNQKRVVMKIGWTISLNNTCAYARVCYVVSDFRLTETVPDALTIVCAKCPQHKAMNIRSQWHCVHVAIQGVYHCVSNGVDLKLGNYPATLLMLNITNKIS